MDEKSIARCRILIVDDHAMVRRGLRAFLESEADFEIVGEAADGVTAVATFKALQPDITIMDLRLPDQSGLETTRQIVRIQPSAKIIVVTTSDGDSTIYNAMSSGAAAYLTKDTMETELIAAVRKVLRGQRVLSTSAAAALAENLTRVELSVREHEVLRLIARGMSNAEIGSTLGTAAGTVKMQAHSIFAKLGANDRTEAVTLAMKRGLLEI